VHNPTPVYPNSLIWRSDNSHPALTTLRDYLGFTQPDHRDAETWTPKWAQRSTPPRQPSGKNVMSRNPSSQAWSLITGRQRSRRPHLRSQADALLACDFETRTLTGAHLYVFAVIEHATRGRPGGAAG
jgi:hypothetical protein